jgi:ATP-dependent RNA helicase RhlE
VVSTDLAARGIDIAQLPVVVNFDLPRSPPTTCTASAAPGAPVRAGWRSASSARRRRRTLPDRKAPGFEPAARGIDGFEPTDVAAPPAPDLGGGNGGIKGRRPSKKDKLRAAAAAAAAGGGGT